MAEIKIEKKRAIWQWVLLALVAIVGIIYLYYSLTTTKDNEVAETTNNTAVAEPSNSNIAAVSEFVSYVNSDTNKMGLDHTYTSGALLKLTEAVKAKANEIGYDVNADLEKAREYADKITHDETATSHADNIRKAADILSTSLENMQQAKYPALSNDAKELKDAAAAIKPDVLTLEQKDAVKTFFSDAANLLQKMS